MSEFVDRMIRAAKLDPNLYEEVEANEGAMGQAMAVVVLSSIASGIGTGVSSGLSGILIGVIAGLIGWFIWAYLTYIIGTRVLPEPQTSSTHGELLRTIGFASSPGILLILGVIPGMLQIVFTIVSIWTLLTMVVAVRQALDYKSTWRAVGVCVIGWIVRVMILTIVFGFLKGTA